MSRFGTFPDEKNKKTGFFPADPTANSMTPDPLRQELFRQLISHKLISPTRHDKVEVCVPYHVEWRFRQINRLGNLRLFRDT